MRRVPKKPSQFTKTASVPTGSARRNGVVPKQTKLSVQDVRTYATKEGAAMSNEEMRRLRLWADGGAAVAEESGGGAGAGTAGNKPYVKVPDSSPDSKVATELTVEHNDKVVVSKTTKILDFHDTNIASQYYNYLGDWFDTQNKWKITKSGNDQAIIYAKPKIPLHQYRVGQVALNKIPVDYVGDLLSSDYLDNKYKYKGYYSSLQVQFGHIVYAVIEHNFGLYNKNYFNLHLIDRNEGGLDDPDSMLYPDQISIVQVEGWDANRLLIYGILKPERYVYTGVTRPEPALQLANIDDPTTALTNAIFDYVLIKGE